MHAKYTQFKIEQHKQDMLILVLETISVFMLSIFVTVFLPSLLFQYVYANAQLTAEPATIRYIPVASFVTAILFFIYVLFQVIRKLGQIKKLTKQLEEKMTDDDGCCSCSGQDHHDQMIHEDVITPVLTEKSNSKKTVPSAKKSTRKSK